MLAKLWGKQSPEPPWRGRCSAGQGAPESVSLETPHPGPGGSEGRVPGQGPAVPLQGAGCPPISGAVAVSPPILFCGPHRPLTPARGGVSCLRLVGVF